MSTALLILLLGAVRWTASHVIYGKDPGRLTRHPYDEWRPVREAPAFGRLPHLPPHHRYPVYHHSKGYSYAPSKKVLAQQLAQSSDAMEVFSPAPPTILGSLSLFGHATVNAREPAASHVTKKSPRPQYTVDYPHYERPKVGGYQVRNQFVSPAFYQQPEAPKRPNRFNDYNDPYFYESTLRPPPRDSINKVSSYTPSATHQSTSLTPNSFYFEQPQPFQPSAVDNSFEKVRKPINSYHFSSSSGFSTPASLDSRTPVNEYESQSGAYFNLHNKKSHTPSSWVRNPFGDIQLSTRRPEIQVKPVTEDKEPAKDIYNQYSHLSRPFQSSQYTTTVDSQKDVDTYSPYVTTYPSPVETHNVKFSDVAQPFQVNDEYRTQGVPLNKPDYVVTQDPYQDAYPITVTTIDVPTESSRDTKKKHKDSYKGESYLSAPTSRPFSKNKQHYDTYSSNHRPQVQITSYQGYNEHIPASFLPTPTPDMRPYAPQPTIEEETTDQPEVSSNVDDYNYISTMDNKYRDKVEDVTDYSPTTTVAIETTTTPSPRTRPTIKSRRRPTRPSQMSKTSEATFKNHRVPEDEWSNNGDYYKYQRRRKPTNKYRESGDYKRFRTTSSSTTTTTASPAQFDTTEPFEDATTVSEAPKVISNNIFGRPQDNPYSGFDQYYNSYSDLKPQSDIIFSSQAPERDMYSLNYADIFAEQTTPSTTTTSTTTTTTTTPPPAVSVTTPSVESSSSSIPARLRNKYGSNRPRFSVKDYRDKLSRGSSTTATPTNADDETTPKPRNDIPKILSRMRPSHQSKPSTEATPSSQDDETTPEPKYRKYKPRLGPSRQFYKTSTTPAPDVIGDTTTTERVNTFRPSTNRYKPGSGKYYSRYRTSTTSPKEVDDSPVTTAKITIKPKGVFSAKRRPYPMKGKLDEAADADSSSEDAPSTPNFGDTLKINDNEVVHNALKKIDDGPTTTISSEDKSVNMTLEAPTQPSKVEQAPVLPPTGNEAMRVADLTSSSSNNDFHSSSVFKTNIITNRRILPKIALPTEEPILPLEAFFQTRQNNK